MCTLHSGILRLLPVKKQCHYDWVPTRNRLQGADTQRRRRETDPQGSGTPRFHSVENLFYYGTGQGKDFSRDKYPSNLIL